MMMPKHLIEKLNHFLRRDTFIKKPKQQLATATDGRSSRDASSLASHFCLWCLAARSPGLAEKCGQGNVRFVLEIQYCTVFLHGSPNLRDFIPQPFLSCCFIDLVVFTLRLLIGQARIAKSPSNRILGQLNSKLVADDAAKTADCPKVGFKTEGHCSRKNDLANFFFRQLFQFSRTPAS